MGVTDPSACCLYSMVTWVLPSGRSHQREPSLPTWTPPAMSGDCLLMRTRTSQLSQERPLDFTEARSSSKGVEADLADLVADDLLVIEVGGGGDLAEDHDHVVLGGGLAGDLGERVGLEARIEDGVRHLVGKLVGVAFIDRLRGEKEVALFADHGCCC